MITKITDLQEPSQSHMFLIDVTVIDFAYIDNEGCVKGGSFHPSFIVSGSPDPIEKVVVDFSSVKKEIKNSIDKHVFDVTNNGFDHKLWIIEGYSKVDIHMLNPGAPDIYLIRTPNLTLSCPSDAIKVISPQHNMNYFSGEAIGNVIGHHVASALQLLHPKTNIRVLCLNSEEPHLARDVNSYGMFRYVHGLKDSTSYGCKNIAHGHLSYIHTDVDSVQCSLLLNDICDNLNDTIFIRQDNIISQTPSEIEIGYNCSRGFFNLRLNIENSKIVILPTETTVEFLVEYVSKVFGSQLLEIGATKIFVSEGLSKGSMTNIKGV